jgi:nucleoside phosphorylase
MPAPLEALVVAAQPEEVAALLSRHRRGETWRSERVRAQVLSLSGRRIVVAVTGEGRRCAEKGLAALLDRYGVSEVLAIGLAGALSAELEVGALVEGRSLRLQGEEPRKLVTLGMAALRGAEIVTVDRVVSGVRDRQQLLASCDSTIPVAVDMEAAFYAAVAASRGMPLSVVKAISDSADEELPPFLARCRREDGSLDRTRIAMAALLRPASLPRLLELRRRARAGSNALAGVVEEWLCTPSHRPS